jgi:6-phosphofructokinase 1
VNGPEYKIETFLTPLATVARETKHLDPSYIKDGNDITDAFKDYARPLVGELPRVGSFGELKK